MTVDIHGKNVFDLALPSIAYHDTTDPDEVHRLIGQARKQSPVAMGPYGPELLTYDLVRTVLRDSRFAMPQGIGLVVQGISSGPVWDRVCRLLISLDGAEHQRLRRLVSRAFTPRAAERMTPENSCEGIIGVRAVSSSLRQLESHDSSPGVTAAACTSTSTSPFPANGLGASS